MSSHALAFEIFSSLLAENRRPVLHALPLTTPKLMYKTRANEATEEYRPQKPCDYILEILDAKIGDGGELRIPYLSPETITWTTLLSVR